MAKTWRRTWCRWPIFPNSSPRKKSAIRWSSLRCIILNCGKGGLKLIDAHDLFGRVARMSVELDQIIPWGRSRLEYELMFRLGSDDLRGRILGCGDGPASFNAEMTAAGHFVVSVDPIYFCSGSEIGAKFEASSEKVIGQVRATLGKWNWDYHRDPDGLLAN